MMSYKREIPRDLFNEASLLKCLGQLWLKLEGSDLFATLEFYEEGNWTHFEIAQEPGDGSISVENITFTAHDRVLFLRRPLNSRQPWPLYVVDPAHDFEDVDVFDDRGELSADFLALTKRG